MKIAEVLGIGPVIPVVVLEDPDTATQLARALLNGGVHTIEVTLRTAGALAAIERIAVDVPELVVGAGTVTTGEQVRAARAAGARFLVSPGATPRLLDALEASELPFLAGCATASDVIALVERGHSCAKLFPAEAAGGLALARALAGPFPHVRLCPTGGIDPQSAPDWLALPNVACVGGTWIARGPLPGDDGWSGVTARARAAAELRPRTS